MKVYVVAGFTETPMGAAMYVEGVRKDKKEAEKLLEKVKITDADYYWRIDERDLL